MIEKLKLHCLCIHKTKHITEFKNVDDDVKWREQNFNRWKSHLTKNIKTKKFNIKDDMQMNILLKLRNIKFKKTCFIVDKLSLFEY